MHFPQVDVVVVLVLPDPFLYKGAWRKFAENCSCRTSLVDYPSLSKITRSFS